MMFKVNPMAVCAIGLSPGLEGVELRFLRVNSSTRLIRTNYFHLIGKASNSIWRNCGRIRCSSRNSVSPLESRKNAMELGSVATEEDLDHVMKFKISDFEISDRVSIGLGGRVRKLITTSALYVSLWW